VEDVLVGKLLALNEHHLEYLPLLNVGRALREQIGWAEVRRRTAHSPYARAYFTLVEGLGIVEPGPVPSPAGDEVTVRAEEPEPSGAEVSAFGPGAGAPH